MPGPHSADSIVEELATSIGGAASTSATPLAHPRDTVHVQPRLAIVAAWLATSTALTLAQWLDRTPVVDALVRNASPIHARNAVIAITCGVALIAALMCMRAQVAGRDGTRLLSLLSPLAVAFAVPALFVRELWAQSEIALLVYAGAVGLVTERLLRLSLGAINAQGALDRLFAACSQQLRSPRMLAWLALTAMIALYVVMIGHYALINHWNMNTTSSDLAEFDNLFFNALHGHPFRAPAIDADLKDWAAFKVHAELMLYLVLPLYALRPGPETLLLIQTVVVALTCIPIYAFAARRLGRAAGLVLAALYLLMPMVQRPNFYDFHFTPIGMFFVAATLALHDAATSSRAARYASYVTFACALMSREDTAAGLGLALLILTAAGVRTRASFVLGSVAFAYVMTVKFALMPLFGPSWLDSIYAQLRAPGIAGMRGVFATLITNPVFVARAMMTETKLLYALHMIVPLLALWLRRPWLLAAVLPGALFTLLVTDRPAMSMSTYQYAYLCVPYLVLASVLGAQALRARADGSTQLWSALTAALLTASACTWNQGALLGAEHVLAGASDKPLVHSAVDRAELADIQRLARLIPKDATVAATEREGPHVSTRLTLFSLKHSLGDAPDYLLLGEVGLRHEQEHVTNAIESGNYRWRAQAGRFRLLQRSDKALTKPQRKALLARAL